MRRLPPLTALEAFVQVARTGSVKAAAAELALSTPALSRRVQALERYMGMSLFERRHQQMELNADGERLMEEIGPALDGVAAAIDSVLTGQREIRLRLGAMPLFASQRLLPRMAELRASWPELQVDIDTSRFATSRLGDTLDAAIILARHVDTNLYAREIDRDRIQLIAGRAGQQGPNAVHKPEDLAGQTLLVHRGMSKMFDCWREAIGMPELTPRSVQHYDSAALMLEAAAQGFGIAVLHERHLEYAQDDRLIALFPATVQSPYHYFFVCRPRALQNKAVRIFHDWLISVKI